MVNPGFKIKRQRPTRTLRKNLKRMSFLGPTISKLPKNLSKWMRRRLGNRRNERPRKIQPTPISKRTRRPSRTISNLCPGSPNLNKVTLPRIWIKRLSQPQNLRNRRGKGKPSPSQISKNYFPLYSKKSVAKKCY